MALLAPAVLVKATAAVAAVRPSFPPIRHQRGSFRGSSEAAEAAAAEAAAAASLPPSPSLCDAQRKAPSVKSELGVRTGLRAAVRPARPPAAAAAELWARARERERAICSESLLLTALSSLVSRAEGLLPSPLLLCWATVHFRSSCTHTISPTTAMEWVGTDSLAPSPAVAPLRDREEGEEGRVEGRCCL